MFQWQCFTHWFISLRLTDANDELANFRLFTHSNQEHLSENKLHPAKQVYSTHRFWRLPLQCQSLFHPTRAREKGGLRFSFPLNFVKDGFSSPLLMVRWVKKEKIGMFNRRGESNKRVCLKVRRHKNKFSMRWSNFKGNVGVLEISDVETSHNILHMGSSVKPTSKFPISATGTWTWMTVIKSVQLFNTRTKLHLFAKFVCLGVASRYCTSR